METIISLAVLMGVLAATDIATGDATDPPTLDERANRLPPCDLPVQCAWPSFDPSEPIYPDLTRPYEQLGKSPDAPTSRVRCDG